MVKRETNHGREYRTEENRTVLEQQEEREDPELELELQQEERQCRGWKPGNVYAEAV